MMMKHVDDDYSDDDDEEDDGDSDDDDDVSNHKHNDNDEDDKMLKMIKTIKMNGHSYKKWKSTSWYNFLTITFLANNLSISSSIDVTDDLVPI